MTRIHEFDGDELHAAGGEGAGFVEDERLEGGEGFKMPAAFEDDAFAGQVAMAERSTTGVEMIRVQGEATMSRVMAR